MVADALEIFFIMSDEFFLYEMKKVIVNELEEPSRGAIGVCSFLRFSSCLKTYSVPVTYLPVRAFLRSEQFRISEVTHD